MSDGLLTEEEVRFYLEVDRPTVEKLIRRGKLTAYRLDGRYIRYRKDQVMAIRSGRKFHLADRLERHWLDRARDFWNFYSLYFLLVLLAILAVVSFIQF